MLESIGVLAVASISGTATRLNVGRAPRFWAYRTQKSGWVERTSTNLHV
jgi:hypothetical protein